jgi:hypothetical protein
MLGPVSNQHCMTAIKQQVVLIIYSNLLADEWFCAQPTHTKFAELQGLLLVFFDMPPGHRTPAGYWC